MAKKYASMTKHIQPDIPASPSPLNGWLGVFIAVAFIFILTLAGSMDNIIEKWTGLISAIIIMLLLFVSRKAVVLKDHIKPLFFSVTAYIIWGGISTFYAASGKLAIFEFSKLLVALCVYLLVLFFTDPNESGFKKISYVLASAGCFFGILSVDAASYGLLSNIFKSFWGLFTEAYEQRGAFEQGVRITSIIGNPNIYAGFMALAVLFSLYLVIHAENKGSHRTAAAMLAVNALSYLLAFSMGSLFMFLIACLVMIGLSEKGKRFELFLLMSETAILSFIFAYISLIGLGKSGVIALMPLFALVLNAVFLALLDERFRKPFGKRLNTKGKQSLRIALLVAVIIICYSAAAFLITNDLSMNANESSMRAIYVPGGEYSLVVESSVPVNLLIESQNQYDLMRHTSTPLYTGTNEQEISFSVPDDSKIVKINFLSTVDNNNITTAYYAGAKSGKIHLNYPLLPKIITNRTQDLLANENFVQRTIFFEDGMKLFSKSPIIGRGLGGFENGVYSVQDFYYETKYTHNHYIQVLSDLGIVGFVLFMSMLVFSALSIVLSKRRSRSLFAVPVLAACTIQMFGQALTDAIWSTGIFLGFASAIMALITIFCSEPIRLKESSNRDLCKKIEKAVLAVFTGVFILLLSGNLYAQAQAKAGVEDFEEIERLIIMDRFEYNDYKLSYLVNAPKSDDPEVISQADIYVQELMNVESNSLTPYIMAYNFETYKDFDAFQAAKHGIKNSKSNPNTWIRIFDSFEEYIDPVGSHTNDAAERLKSPETYVNDVLEIYDLLLERNMNSLDDITLSPYNDSFIGKLLEIKASNLYSIDWVFTALMTYAFDSECAVDTNQDGIPDNLSVLSGSIQKDEAGAFKVTGNTAVDLVVYHKLGGEYTFLIRTDKPQGIKVVLNGQPQTVLYDKNSASVVIDLQDNSEMNLSKFTVNFPTETEFDSITFTTKLE